MWQKLRKWIAYARARLGARRHARSLLQARPVKRLLVVCYGNIYRSPFVAERLRNDGTFEVRSAGFHPTEGRRCAPDFVAIARDFGATLEDHRSRLLRPEDIEWADIIVIMDDHNYRQMHQSYAHALRHTFWLGAVSRLTPILIADPYKQSKARQREIANEMDRACKALLKALSDREAAS